MVKLDISLCTLKETDGVFIYKNRNTTLGFIRFNNIGEIEYIFVNPLFRKQGIAKNLLKLVKDKTGKKLILQKPISPLGAKLLKSVENWI
ncbi:GNAT family N-acetyltransferase [Candidatus Pelagibacter communis]|uniref:GNAT family N-acetyltransferase n=1 Tax=Pelagibacter ubique TaxID=198252 RepID=UPI00094C7D67|nr:GNAT family N-acetyltransferase [Candidatus Pelagibacter ubique]|tara:strand:+ start:877 stop:1146 length:270 start_codon:yes stop_codon:yes gene_type:complete